MIRTVKKISRFQVAQLLNIHEDTVTRSLRDGLGSAVIEWGGAGKSMVFAEALVLRWRHAKNCRRANCVECEITIEDCKVIANHLAGTQHGWAGCEECSAPWLLDQRQHL